MAPPAAIILNPRSGKAPSSSEIERAIQQSGLHAELYSLPEGAGTADWLARVAEEHEVLVAAGGDGTISTVAAAVVKAQKTLGVIPAGTLNHFARDAGIPTELDKAVAVIASGYTRLLDVGVISDVTFINNASIGAYPRMLWERNRARQKGLPKPIATAFAVIRTWLGFRTITVRLSVDGTELVRRTPFVFIGNSKYEVEGLKLGRRLTMTDGSLWLYVAPDSGRLDALALPVRALLGILEEHDKFEILQASSISIDMSRLRVSAALDGEMRLRQPPLRFGVLRYALRTIVPAG